MQALLQIRNLGKTYGQQKRGIRAVTDLDLDIYQGEFLGLIGESGCGKSTLARLVAGLEQADGGWIINNSDSNLSIQMVFQNAQDSFNPRLTLGQSVAEYLYNQNLPQMIIREKTSEYLKLCGLSMEFAKRYPHQVSGGECQRAAIARALISQTRLLICDEPTSALDVCTQAQIIDILNGLKKDRRLSCLFITHDIALAQQICDRLAVMQAGAIVEIGPTEQIINRAKCAYTKELLNIASELSRN